MPVTRTPIPRLPVPSPLPFVHVPVTAVEATLAAFRVLLPLSFVPTAVRAVINPITVTLPVEARPFVPPAVDRSEDPPLVILYHLVSHHVAPVAVGEVRGRSSGRRARDRADVVHDVGELIMVVAGPDQDFVVGVGGGQEVPALLRWRSREGSRQELGLNYGAKGSALR